MKTNGFPQASEATRRLNPHLFGNKIEGDQKPTLRAKQVIRLRQSKELKLNLWEREYSSLLKAARPDSFICEQAIKFVLGNGVTYTPDAVVFSPLVGAVEAYEVKGFMRDDAACKLKIAARQFPFIKWTLVWKRGGMWHEQVVLA